MSSLDVRLKRIESRRPSGLFISPADFAMRTAALFARAEHDPAARPAANRIRELIERARSRRDGHDTL